MTIDKSLKVRRGLISNRSVLSRAERIQKLITSEKFDAESDSPVGLPKVRVQKLSLKKKKKVKKDDEEEK